MKKKSKSKTSIKARESRSVSGRLLLHGDGGQKSSAVVRGYDPKFRPSDAYRKGLPDLMEANGAVEGARVVIPQVGIDGLRIPMKFAVSGKTKITVLEARVTGTVSLAASLKGINMSRIVRSFYDHRDELCSPDLLGKILKEYRKVTGSLDARLRVKFSFPAPQASLRSGLTGFQYYDAAYEASLDSSGHLRRYVELDFVYSSACPCSAELAEHARTERGVYAVGHSQRSKARLRIEIAAGKRLGAEDLRRHCIAALRTETQVMVKREDEQAFAELNGAYLKFVEDAVRLLYSELNGDVRIADFLVSCAHYESLHSHDAVALIAKGVAGGMRADAMNFGC